MACIVFTLPDGRIESQPFSRVLKTYRAGKRVIMWQKKGGDNARGRGRVFRVQTKDWRASVDCRSPCPKDGQGKKQDQKTTCPRVHGGVHARLLSRSMDQLCRPRQTEIRRCARQSCRRCVAVVLPCMGCSRLVQCTSGPDGTPLLQRPTQQHQSARFIRFRSLVFQRRRGYCTPQLSCSGLIKAGGARLTSTQ